MTNLLNPPDWNAATRALNAAESVLVVTHIKPDGDAIGSALGLANAITRMGKQVTVAVDDGVPGYLQFLPGVDRFAAALTDGTWDLMISTDSSDEARTGLVGEYGRAYSQTVINLDLHITNTGFGNIHLVVTTAVSAAEVVYDWWQSAGVTLTHDIAMPLLTGMVTDTLGFRVSSVTPRTLAIAQDLMAQGIKLHTIISRTLDTMSYEALTLWQRVLPSAQREGQVIHATISRADLDSVGDEESADSGLVSFLVNVDDVAISVLFKEVDDETTRISMRCKLGWDVGAVALSLGGGGHKQAAGAEIKRNLADTRSLVLPMLHAAAEAGSPQ